MFLNTHRCFKNSINFKKCCSHLSFAYSTHKPDKDFSGSFPKVYNSSQVESGWYEWWEKNGIFKSGKSSETSRRETFSMVLPPPNVTGDLHLGHALTVAIQDSLARWYRMKGFDVRWIPGCDHAGIATQVIVEKNLWSEKKLTRHQLGRKEFLKAADKWSRKKQTIIQSQLKHMGASLDFSNHVFTMDKKLSKAVTHAFVKLFDEGLIYRQKKFVNWSCWLQSTISDIEVEHRNAPKGSVLRVPGHIEGVEIGLMEKFAYKVKDEDTEIVVATSRLETMLADTAVVVNPNDDRYKSFLGKFVLHPFTKASLPVIADEGVKLDFGTGAVKVTPAYDPEDYRLSQKHNIPIKEIFDDNGHVSPEFEIPAFQGVSRFTLRKVLRKALQNKGLYRGKIDQDSVIPVCSRSGDIVDYRLKPQWFLKCSKFAETAAKVVKDGNLKIIPKNYANVWLDWMSKLEDWCISRQLWWGHQIPAYLIKNNTEQEMWISGCSPQEAAQKASSLLNIPVNEVILEQDEDVLDTWFSSALFPFSVHGWPEQSSVLDKYYPLSLMETGHDILFFWVARMVMLGNHLTEKLPFDKVVLHGMIRDTQGRKMSKSLGNVIDPMDIIQGRSMKELKNRILESHQREYISKEELKTALASQKESFPTGIPESGADSLRFTLLNMDIKAEIISFDLKYLIQSLHFCNKIWQAVRFFLGASEKLNVPVFQKSIEDEKRNLQLEDLWILSKLANMVSECNKGFSDVDTHVVTSSIQQFWIKSFCDIYLESIKPAVWEGDQLPLERVRLVMATCIQTVLKALSPIMPFLSEELHHRIQTLLGFPVDISICLTEYPETEEWSHWKDTQLEKDIEFVMDIVTTVRRLKDNFKLKQVKAFAVLSDAKDVEKCKTFVPFLKTLAKADSFDVLLSNKWNPSQESHWTQATANKRTEVYVEVQAEDLINQQKRADETRAALKQKLDKLEILIAKKKYTAKTPLNIQEKHRKQIEVLEAELQKLQG